MEKVPRASCKNAPESEIMRWARLGRLLYAEVVSLERVRDCCDPSIRRIAGRQCWDVCLHAQVASMERARDCCDPWIRRIAGRQGWDACPYAQMVSKEPQPQSQPPPPHLNGTRLCIQSLTEWTSLGPLNLGALGAAAHVQATSQRPQQEVHAHHCGNCGRRIAAGGLLFLQDGAVLPMLIARKAVRDIVVRTTLDHLSRDMLRVSDGNTRQHFM